MSPEYRLSLDPAELQLDVIHGYLTRSYWSPGIPRETVARAIAHSLCIGAYQGADQVGFARVITDRAAFAWLADVFVLEAHQGRGIAKAMLAALHAHPELQGLRRWMLVTLDAHSLYADLGWEPISEPGRFMERYVPDIYSKAAE